MGAIFQSHSEFPVYGDRWLNAETHAGKQGLFVTQHHITPFVTVHPDPMARPVRATGDLVSGSEASIREYFARGNVYILARITQLGGGKTGSL
jgi:hypothetical protein